MYDFDLGIEDGVLGTFKTEVLLAEGHSHRTYIPKTIKPDDEYMEDFESKGSLKWINYHGGEPDGSRYKKTDIAETIKLNSNYAENTYCLYPGYDNKYVVERHESKGFGFDGIDYDHSDVLYIPYFKSSSNGVNNVFFRKFPDVWGDDLADRISDFKIGNWDYDDVFSKTSSFTPSKIGTSSKIYRTQSQWDNDYDNFDELHTIDDDYRVVGYVYYDTDGGIHYEKSNPEGIEYRFSSSSKRSIYIIAVRDTMNLTTQLVDEGNGTPYVFGCTTKKLKVSEINKYDDDLVFDFKQDGRIFTKMTSPNRYQSSGSLKRSEEKTKGSDQLVTVKDIFKIFLCFLK